MERFLQRCHDRIQNKSSTVNVHAVLGNEACDLDSAVSAITLAYYLAKTSSCKNWEYVPVLNIPRQDFPLRTEITFFLKEQGISEEHLTFRDEIDIENLYESGRLVLTLVDHNVLPSADSYMEDVVTEVLDHHTLERREAPSCRVVSEPVGSCTTLVAEKLIRGSPDLVDSQLASLLRGTIILDCVNMAPAAGKVTPKDSEYVALLESMFPDLPPRTAVFDSLQKAKFDVSGLTTEQMLRKDMKALISRDICLAISALYIRLEDFLSMSDVESDLSAFCEKHGYNVLIAMIITFGSDNQPMRQMAVYSPHQELRTLICKVLEDSTNPPLDLFPVSSDPCKNLATYHQGNTIASRKKILPILKNFLRQRDLGESVSQSMQPLQENAKSKGHTDSGVQPACDGMEEQEFGLQFGDKLDNLDSCVGEELKGTGTRSHFGFKKPTDDGIEEENSFPPTPMNSLVDGCPLDRGLPKLTAEDLLDMFNRIKFVDPEDKSTPEKK